jgi:septal ring factor EnvC (AmiA/AmiB activator)
MIKRAALILAMSMPVMASGPQSALERAQADVAAAAKRQQALSAAAEQARGRAAEMAARRQEAAARIDLAEARIGESAAALADARFLERAAEDRLAEARAPAAALVAGLVTMARRPPLLVLADGGSIAQLVHTRALLDSSLPAIRTRSQRLAREAESAAQRTRQVVEASRALAVERGRLAEARTHFASLERDAELRAGGLEQDAFMAADRVIAGSDDVGALGREAERAAEGRKTAGLLSRLQPLPARPTAAREKRETLPFAYRLPSTDPVAEGMGAVDEIGVAARGVTLDAPAGRALVVPADGRILFAGPYRRLDGLVIIDHGGGWTSVVTNVRAVVAKGDRVKLGQPLGNAIGPVTVELRGQNALRSAALIARSSVSLSNGAATR